MSTTPTRNPELMFLGRECHHPACHLNDFLPFSCPACHLSFCQPHFLPSQHSCTAPLPPSMIDRIAPQCPLCNQVVPTSTSRDANEAVDRHILDGICVGLPGGEEKRKAELKGKKERGEVCWRKGCTKTLIVPMKCESCRHSFCPPHRSTQSHSCTPTSSRTGTPQPSSSKAGSSRTAAGTNGAKAAMSRLLPAFNAKSSSSSKSAPLSKQPAKPSASTPKPIATYSGPTTEPEKAPMDVRAAAAAAATKRAGKDVKANVPFVKTKTEKRANNELASQIQALKNRHDKGLLSKSEELRYAELMAEHKGIRGLGQGGKGKDGCVVS